MKENGLFCNLFFSLGGYSGPDMYIPPHIFDPTDRELFEAEAEVIKRIASDHSAVIIGRCGSHILQGPPESYQHIFTCGYSGP